MAENTAMRSNALPYPVYGSPFTITFPILDNTGENVTGAAGLDSERSLNGDTPADCTNEATEIGSSGKYYLSLTAAELTCDILDGKTKTSTTDAKTTNWTLYPRKLVTVRSGTSASAGIATSTIVLDASASAVDDFYNGMLCIATIDGNIEARIISDYTGSTQTASVVPDWNVAPDNNDTFIIKLPEGVQIPNVNVTHWKDAAAGATHTAGYPVVTVKDGTGTGEIDTSAGAIAHVILCDTTTTTTTATNLTNAPTAGDFTATMKTSLSAATPAVTVSDKTGFSIAGTTTTLDALFTALGNAHGAGSWATAVSVAVSDKTGFSLSSSGLDAILVESGIGAGVDLTNDTGTQLTAINFRQAVSLTVSALGAVVAGAATTAVTFKPAGKPAGNTRISATVDASGNRSAVTLKVPD